jgi:asparagine synthase (glutamine-hydrolysing)
VTAICLFWHQDRSGDARAAAGRMLEALRPHGRHHQALWSDGRVALGRALYRTLPEDSYDRQPVRAAGGTVTIVADLRLDNREELAGLLQLSPAEVAAMADSTFLARAWERWGEDCVAKLLGDFAFIAWDAREQRIFCARDGLGRRPLFYHRGQDFIAIASMPKGLLALPDVPAEIDEQTLGGFLASLPETGAGNPFGARSFYRGIERLAPGCSLVASRLETNIRRHWSAQDAAPVRYKRDEDYVERARELIDQAVRVRLRSAGKIGSHLSGGLDSSTVAVTAARLLGLRNERLTAFTAVPRHSTDFKAPPGAIADEGPVAADAVRRFANVDHVLVPYPHAPILAPFLRNLFANDAPTRNLCNLAWADQIDSQARERDIRVMLHAPLGNATISYSGLERFNQMLSRGRILQWMTEVILMSRKQRRPWRQIARHVLLALPHRLRHDVRIALGIRGVRLAQHSPLAPEFIREHGLDERRSDGLRPWSDRRIEQGWRVRMIDFVDPGTIVAGAIASGGYELRDPTSDRRLVEFCLGLPLEQFYRKGEERLLVRRVMREELPGTILDTGKRGLQGVGWLDNAQLSQSEILSEIQAMRNSSLGSRMLALDTLEHLARTIPGDAAGQPSIVTDYRVKLLRGLAAARFIRHVEGRNI